MLSGSARAQCRLNGQWSSSLPACKGHQLLHNQPRNSYIPANASVLVNLWDVSTDYFVYYDTHYSLWMCQIQGEGQQPEKTLKWGNWCQQLVSKDKHVFSSDIKLNRWAANKGGFDPKSETQKSSNHRWRLPSDLWRHFHIYKCTHTHFAQSWVPSNTI